jgi:hypothetical protein
MVFAPLALISLVCIVVLTIAGILKVPPRSVTFGELRTFRDLAKAIADHAA